jgi:hypothetical protein
MLAQTYLPRRAADIFGRTNNGHTPLAAILLCSSFGFVSLAGLSWRAYDQVTNDCFIAARFKASSHLFCADARVAPSNAVSIFHWIYRLCLRLRVCYLSQVQSWVRNVLSNLAKAYSHNSTDLSG